MCITFFLAVVIIVVTFVICWYLVKKNMDVEPQILINVVFVCALVITISAFLLMKNHYICANNNDYLAFEGAILACMATLLGVTYTIKKQEDETNKKISEEKEGNKKLREEVRAELKNMARIQAMPILDYYLLGEKVDDIVSTKSNSIIDFSYEFDDFIILNVRFNVNCLDGKPAKNIYISSVRTDPRMETCFSQKRTPYLTPGKDKDIYSQKYKLPLLSGPDETNRSTMPIGLVFMVNFMDIYENEYTQKISGTIKIEYNQKETTQKHKSYSVVVEEIDKPVLKKSIETTIYK